MELQKYDNFFKGFTFADFINDNKVTSYFSQISLHKKAIEKIPDFKEYLNQLVFLGVDPENEKYYKIKTLIKFDGNEFPKDDIEEISLEEFESYRGKYGILIFFEEKIVPSVVSVIINNKEKYYKFKKKSLVDIDEKGIGIGSCRGITFDEFLSENNENNTQRIIKKNILINRRNYEGLIIGRYYLIPKKIKFGNKGITDIYLSDKENVKLKILLEDGSLNYREISHICEFLTNEFCQIGVYTYMRNYPALLGFVTKKKTSYKSYYNMGMDDGNEVVDEKINFFISTFYFRLITFMDNNLFFKINDFIDNKISLTLLDNSFYTKANFKKNEEQYSNGVKLGKKVKFTTEDLINFEIKYKTFIKENNEGLYEMSFSIEKVYIEEKENKYIFDYNKGVFEDRQSYELKDLNRLKKWIKNNLEEEFYKNIKKYLYESNIKYNFGVLGIAEEANKEFFFKKYPNIKENSEKDYYLKFLKLSILRYYTLLRDDKIIENIKEMFLEYDFEKELKEVELIDKLRIENENLENAIIELESNNLSKNKDLKKVLKKNKKRKIEVEKILKDNDSFVRFASVKLFSAFDPFLRGKIKEGTRSLRQKRTKYGISIVNGDVSRFDEDGNGYFRVEED